LLHLVNDMGLARARPCGRRHGPDTLGRGCRNPARFLLSGY